MPMSSVRCLISPFRYPAYFWSKEFERRFFRNRKRILYTDQKLSVRETNYRMLIRNLYNTIGGRWESFPVRGTYFRGGIGNKWTKIPRLLWLWVTFQYYYKMSECPISIKMMDKELSHSRLNKYFTRIKINNIKKVTS